MSTTTEYGVSWDCDGSPCTNVEQHQRDEIRKLSKATMEFLVLQGSPCWNPPGTGKPFQHPMKGHTRTVKISDWREI